MKNSVQVAKKIFVCLIIVEVLFAVIYFASYFFNEPFPRIHKLFNLDTEANIPTWFSTVQLLMIGVFALYTAYRPNFSSPPSKRGLIIFGFGFVYLSMDEASSIHEKLTYEFHNHPWVPYFDGVHGIWIVVYGVIGLIVLAVLAKDIWAICRQYRRESVIFIIGMIIYLAGAGGAETVTYFYIDKTNVLVYTIEVIVEEFLEMFGASILLYSVLVFSIKKIHNDNSLKHQV